MRLVMSLTVFAALLVLVAFTGQTDRAATQSQVKAPQKQRVVEKCRSAREAVVYYRNKTYEYQDRRSGKRATLSPIVRGKSCHWSRYAAGEWQARARSAKKRYLVWYEENRILSGESEIRAYVNDDCLEEIIDRETAGTWSPTIYNYQGSGAYGLPQALPGHKMSSAGADWRTNPKTQIEWMRRYVIERYGGSCSALSYHNANGNY